MGREDILVETAWLAEHLSDANLRIVDMRGYVRSTPLGPGHDEATYIGAPEEYAAGHIPGAVYIDWTRDIIEAHDPVEAQIAAPDDFAAAMARAGIGDDTFVVAYDAHPASQFATRLWWSLRFYGHDRVAVLDGGLPKWQREGRAMTTELPEVAAAHFTPRPHPELRMTAEQVATLVQQPTSATVLVDARDTGQYSGKKRRGDGRAGHIPGAVNVPRELLIDDTTGTFRDNAQLAQVLDDAGIPAASHVVAYCNGGVAATTVLFALAALGRPDGANYDGSWNEWGSRADLPTTVD